MPPSKEHAPFFIFSHSSLSHHFILLKCNDWQRKVKLGILTFLADNDMIALRRTINLRLKQAGDQVCAWGNCRGFDCAYLDT